MLIASLAGGAAFVAPTLRAPPSRVARHQHPAARQLAFVAKAEKASPPFAESHDVAAWFAEESAIQVLMSQADGAERLDKGEVAGEQRWEVTTGIPFPGMVAKSATTMNVKIDSTPALRISSSESKTVCEGGPGWARAFLARISEIASTTSTNQVELRDVPGGRAFVSTVSLTVALTLPPFLPVPVAAFEKAGSQSIQKLLDQDMPITLSKFRDAYLAWEA